MKKSPGWDVDGVGIDGQRNRTDVGKVLPEPVSGNGKRSGLDVETRDMAKRGGNKGLFCIFRSYIRKAWFIIYLDGREATRYEVQLKGMQISSQCGKDLILFIILFKLYVVYRGKRHWGVWYKGR